MVNRAVRHYNLDAILAVGYRVRSPRGTQFRQWATARLAEFLVKGFTLDDERLEHPPAPDSPDYFDELLERIRDIRASEQRMYLRVRDILALAADYEPSAEETKRVFQIVQNKLHFTVTGKTAAELIAERADFADDQARRRKQIFMQHWATRLDDFLRFNERDVLDNPGSVSHAVAQDHARFEYEQFQKRRRIEAEHAAESRYFAEIDAAVHALPNRARSKPE